MGAVECRQGCRQWVPAECRDVCGRPNDQEQEHCRSPRESPRVLGEPLKMDQPHAAQLWGQRQEQQHDQQQKPVLIQQQLQQQPQQNWHIPQQYKQQNSWPSRPHQQGVTISTRMQAVGSSITVRAAEAGSTSRVRSRHASRSPSPTTLLRTSPSISTLQMKHQPPSAGNGIHTHPSRHPSSIAVSPPTSERRSVSPLPAARRDSSPGIAASLVASWAPTFLTSPLAADSATDMASGTPYATPAAPPPTAANGRSRASSYDEGFSYPLLYQGEPALVTTLRPRSTTPTPNSQLRSVSLPRAPSPVVTNISSGNVTPTTSMPPSLAGSLVAPASGRYPVLSPQSPPHSLTAPVAIYPLPPMLDGRGSFGQPPSQRSSFGQPLSQRSSFGEPESQRGSFGQTSDSGRVGPLVRPCQNGKSQSRMDRAIERLKQRSTSRESGPSRQSSAKGVSRQSSANIPTLNMAQVALATDGHAVQTPLNYRPSWEVLADYVEGTGSS
eukprot:TRINITY_DN6851_c0_g1_i1.p1 TRINITY_DN6851_c0_g1~~TRINITY_DN6851_c0_g1_i1.p1  ORF type:complete len:497 (-),score=46.29 TRINITY_DN6851_c0_g1_i1:441-1931(-)